MSLKDLKEFLERFDGSLLVRIDKKGSDIQVEIHAVKSMKKVDEPLVESV